MYYIDIIILLFIILIIVILIYDVYKKNIKIIKKIEMFNEYNYDKLGPIEFIDNAGNTLGYFPNGEKEDGSLSDRQLQIIKDENLIMTKIKIPNGDTGSRGDAGVQGIPGNEGEQGKQGDIYIGDKGDNGNDGGVCVDGTPAEACGDGPQGEQGKSASECITCEDGKNGNDADDCIPAPAPGTLEGAKDGIDASNCECECLQCDSKKCENTVKLQKIDGTDLVINPNIVIKNTLNMNDNSEICFGSGGGGNKVCINKSIIDKINTL
tara:strand:- start:181 stop:978 length:798 start_codon:yes stop_codon:yes gene_type:complete